MNNLKKYWIIIGIIALLTPLGLILPEYFKAGEAWGEWSLETVKEQTGQEPAGMKKDEKKYKAPLPDYSIENNTGQLSRRSMNYMLSGLFGLAIILIITFGLYKIIQKKKP